LATAATPSNQNVEAYNALLQGNFYSDRQTAEDLRKAIGYYEEAIRLDPRYAIAYAKLAGAASSLANTFVNVATKEGQEALAKARASAKRALELDPNLADAHSEQGAILRFDLNLAEAEAEYRRALELAPQNVSAIGNLAVLISALGRFDEALALHKRAIALDPLRSQSHYNLGLNLTALGRYDEAEAALRKAIELQPQSGTNYTSLAMIQILRGNPGAAVEPVKQETDPFWRTYALALAHSANGDKAEADAALKKLIDEDADDAGSQIATVYALAQGPGEDVRVAGTRVDGARRRCVRALDQSFPARLQGRPALHRLRAKDRCDAENRHALKAASESSENSVFDFAMKAARRLCRRHYYREPAPVPARIVSRRLGISRPALAKYIRRELVENRPPSVAYHVSSLVNSRFRAKT
jgi:tetratricopeptide (TPR) repeat protein